MINKVDLAPPVGADLSVMDRDSKRMRRDLPFLFTNLKTERGLTRCALGLSNCSRSTCIAVAGC